MQTVAIVGASGYIGQHLVAELLQSRGCRVRVLSRTGQWNPQNDLPYGVEVQVFKGNLSEPASLQSFLDSTCTVVNLVYLWNVDESENLKVAANLLSACRQANIQRLIHCSTAAVVGRAGSDIVTENTPCRPVTQYGITKLKIENLVASSAADHFDSAILRPTSVFGPNGNPLQKLNDNLSSGSRCRNYLKSCLFGKRQMNLVHVSNVVAAIAYLIKREQALYGEVFNVSDDDDPLNNFFDVENILMRELKLPRYGLPRIPLPAALLSWILWGLGRNIINQHCKFSPRKLLDMGYRRPTKLEAGLVEYARWYRTAYPESFATNHT